MAELIKPWNDGGSLTVTYEGNGDGSAVFTSDEYVGIDRDMSVTFKDASQSIVIERMVRQEGTRQQIKTTDGFVFRCADGGRFGVLKPKARIPYLEFEALEDGLTFSMTNSTIQYSVDGTSWASLPANTTSPIINVGEKVYLKATGLTPNSSSGIGRFVISKKCNIGGTPMSLLFGDEVDKYNDLTGYPYALRQLFYSCSKVISVSDDFLPATTLSSGCYYGMFMGCSSLTNAPKLRATKLGGTSYYYMFQNCTSLEYPPELPATTVGASEYRSMFQGCTALRVAPTLPATTLAPFCYSHMFEGCSKLNYIKMLATDISAQSCLNTWVSGVSSTGTFVKNPDATWEVYGDDGIPTNWKVIMDGEPEAPSYDFPVNVVADYCEEEFFEKYCYSYADYSELFEYLVWALETHGTKNEDGTYSLQTSAINQLGIVILLDNGGVVDSLGMHNGSDYIFGNYSETVSTITSLTIYRDCIIYDESML